MAKRPTVWNRHEKELTMPEGWTDTNEDDGLPEDQEDEMRASLYEVYCQGSNIPVIQPKFFDQRFDNAAKLTEEVLFMITDQPGKKFILCIDGYGVAFFNGGPQ